MASELGLVAVARRTDRGQVRDHNEDRLLATPALVVVADGMGGAKAGEVAAQIAVDQVAGLAPPLGGARISAAVRGANRMIRDMAAQDPDKAGMGTTITAAIVADGALHVVHVGDSRAYLWRDGALRQLTDDHSVVGALLRAGQLTADEAAAHPHRNVITRALGAESDVEVDTLTEPALAGDVLLLCSDGLPAHLSDAEIAEALAGDGDLDARAEELVRRANAAGGTDNVTVVLALVGEREAAVAPAGEGTGEIAGAQTGELASGAGATAEMGEIGSGSEARSRRRGLRPAVAGVIVLALLAAGAVAWVNSRTFTVHDRDGVVAVSRGLPVSIGGLGLRREWQATGLESEGVVSAEPGTLGDEALGQGEAVLRAARLIWAHGLPPAPRLQAPAIEPPPARRPPAPRARP